MVTRRVSLVYLVLLFISALVVPAPHITIPQITIPEIRILPFTQISIPKITIPSTDLPSIGNLPRVFALAAITVGPPVSGFAGQTIPVTSAFGSFGALGSSGSCQLSSNPVGLFAVGPPPPCSISAAGTLTGSFIVSTFAPGGVYSVGALDQRPGNTGTSASDSFTVRPLATLSPKSGFPPITGVPSVAATTVMVSGFGFSPGDTGCTITSGDPSLIINPPDVTCALDSTTGRVTGTFKVGSSSIFVGFAVPVIVTGTPGGDQPLAAGIPAFTVLPRIALSPTSGAAAAVISYAGSGFTATAGGPAFGCTGGGAGSIFGTPVINPSVCNQDGFGNVFGTFTVGAVSPGSYIVTFRDFSGAPWASTKFSKTGGACATCLITLTPFQGPIGTVVQVGGSGFSAADTMVSISNGAGLFAPDPFTCPIAPAASGIIAPGCTFMVATVAGLAPPGFTVTATGDVAADIAIAQFLILATFTLTPNNGGTNLTAAGGTTVALSGNGYLSVGLACAGEFVNPAPLRTANSCNISAAGVLTGSFLVNNAAVAGVHTYGLTSTADVPQSTISALFTVTVGTLFFTPGSGSGDNTIIFSASGFSTGDTICTLTQTSGAKGNTIASFLCTVAAGVATGSFVVKRAGNGAEVKGLRLAGDTGDALVGFAFTVVPQIDHTLTPNPARLGATVGITGSNFGTMGNCFIMGTAVTGSPVGPIAGCVAADFTLTAVAMFTVLVTFLGSSSLITVTDTTPVSAAATLNIVPRVVTLTPSFGPTGTVVAVGGSGFAVGDAGACTYAPGSSVPLISASTCSIDLAGTVTGSFTVDPAATAGVKTVQVNGATGDFGTAPFTVTAKLGLFPTIGRPGTNVLVTGSGFNAGDTGPCTLSSAPPGLISAGPTCNIGGGSMSGSFVVAGVASGTYTVTVTGITGDFGSATFTVPPAPTLVLGPISGPAGTGVVASGANWVGATCLLTSNPSNLFASQSCTIAGGVLAGSFTVANGANIGTTYTVTAQSNAAESATATFTVSVGTLQTLTLTPNSGPVGTAVTGTAPGFTTDTICTLSSAPTGLFSSSTCSISAGNAVVGFVVSATASAPPSTIPIGGTKTMAGPIHLLSPGTYTVLATGDKGHAASATFTVTATTGFSISVNPSALTLYPGQSAVVSIGVHSLGSFNLPVTLAATGFPTGVAGAFTTNPVVPPAGGSTSTVLIVTVANNAPASTTIVSIMGTSGSLTASGSLALVINSGAATTTATTGVGTLVLSPSSGPTLTVVTVIGSSLAGSSCTLSSSPVGLATSYACSLSGGTLTGSFTVSAGAPVGGYVVTAVTNLGATASALFSVTAPVTPTVTVTGTSTPGGLPFPTPPVPIPGFPWESIIAGLAIAMLTLSMLRRRRERKRS